MNFKRFSYVAAVAGSILLSSTPSYAADLSVSATALTVSGHAINSGKAWSSNGQSYGNAVNELSNYLNASNEISSQGSYPNAANNALTIAALETQIAISTMRGAQSQISASNVGNINELLSQLLALINKLRSSNASSPGNLRGQIAQHIAMIIRLSGPSLDREYHITVRR